MELLDPRAEESLHRLTRLAARSTRAPVSLFTLIDEERELIRSAADPGAVWEAGRTSPLSTSLCRHVASRREPLLIEDAREHPLVADPGILRGSVAYAGVPVESTDGDALGSLCVMDVHPRAWSAPEVESLEEIATLVATHIELGASPGETERTWSAAEEGDRPFRAAFEAAPIGMALIRPDERWIRVNRAFRELLGRTPEELAGESLREVTHPDDREANRSELERLLGGESEGFSRETRFLHRDGHEVWAQLQVSVVREGGGRPAYFVAQVQDVTERRGEEARLWNLSFLDDLTGLYNRRGFLAMAREQLKLGKRQGRSLVLLYADVDDLKWINDTFGHLEGDRALLATAQLLRDTFRESDLIARVGGDEFSVLASTADDDPEPLLERLELRIAETNDEAGGRVRPIRVSVGGTRVDPDEPLPIEQLMERADSSMYRAKGRKQTS